MDEIRVPLCVNGVVEGATASYQCTGSAHLTNGQLVVCSDPTHVKPMSDSGVLSLGPGLTLGPALTGDLTGQQWTCGP